MSIIALLNQIKDGEIVLPAIQRDFVWPEGRVLRLLDSIMRGYPIGIALLWETYNDIQYRSFVSDYRPDLLHKFRENPDRRKLKLVLDGQQRLQSLHIALYGSYCGKELYFDVLSGQEAEDVAEERYYFEFMDSAGFRNWKKAARDDDSSAKHFVKVSSLFEMGTQEQYALKRQLVKDLALSDTDQQRLEINLGQFQQVLSKDPNILKVSVIDENLPDKSPSRKTEADVLEIFVRVNQEATQLSRSDLIFSMLKLNWKESAEDLPQFVKAINDGNSFELDTDFVIRCLFAVSDLGTKFDLNVLRRKNNVAVLRENFAQCCDAIRSSVDFVQRECWCTSSKALGGYNTIVPLVYYLFHTRKHEAPNQQVPEIRKALYLFGFARPFSRYADSRLWRFIRKELKPLVEKKDMRFPFDRAAWWVHFWEDIDSCGEKLIQANPTLGLHIVQNLSGAKTQYQPNVGELDHIFPRSVLRDKGFDEAQINHFANFWILPKGKNQNKSARNPAQYFKDVPEQELERALIDRDLLNYHEFPKFLRVRSEQMIQKVQHRLQFTDKDFLFSD